MRRVALMLLFVVVFTLGLMVPALAHTAGPCDDSDGDGLPSGQEYAEHHIVANAQAGTLGAGGHIPGTHKGFSACDPSGL